MIKKCVFPLYVVLYREGNTALFYDLESHAVKMSSVYMSFSTLMDKLLVADLSDLEKVRHFGSCKRCYKNQFCRKCLCSNICLLCFLN